MYHFVEKEFLARVKSVCSDIVNQLVVRINNEGYMEVKQHLVGSGAKGLVVQNNRESIDLDYNLEIRKLYKFDWEDGRGIKEYIRKKFNEVLQKSDWGDCKDSTSVFTTEERCFKKGNQTAWSIDIAIVCQNTSGEWERLIHQKTGIVQLDRWYWNIAPNSKDLTKKINWLKKNNYWDPYVKDTYLQKKNMYLVRNDHNHPSFICYIETINELYYKFKQ